jgi:hypothetical protein
LAIPRLEDNGVDAVFQDPAEGLARLKDTEIEPGRRPSAALCACANSLNAGDEGMETLLADMRERDQLLGWLRQFESRNGAARFPANHEEFAQFLNLPALPALTARLLPVEDLADALNGLLGPHDNLGQVQSSQARLADLRPGHLDAEL